MDRVVILISSAHGNITDVGKAKLLVAYAPAAYVLSGCDMNTPFKCQQKKGPPAMPCMPRNRFGWSFFADLGACLGVAKLPGTLAIHTATPSVCTQGAEGSKFEEYIAPKIRLLFKVRTRTDRPAHMHSLTHTCTH